MESIKKKRDKYIKETGQYRRKKLFEQARQRRIVELERRVAERVQREQELTFPWVQDFLRPEGGRQRVNQMEEALLKRHVRYGEDYETMEEAEEEQIKIYVVGDKEEAHIICTLFEPQEMQQRYPEQAIKRVITPNMYTKTIQVYEQQIDWLMKPIPVFYDLHSDEILATPYPFLLHPQNRNFVYFPLDVNRMIKTIKRRNPNIQPRELKQLIYGILWQPLQHMEYSLYSHRGHRLEDIRALETPLEACREVIPEQNIVPRGNPIVSPNYVELLANAQRETTAKIGRSRQYIAETKNWMEMLGVNLNEMQRLKGKGVYYFNQAYQDGELPSFSPQYEPNSQEQMDQALWNFIEEFIRPLFQTLVNLYQQHPETVLYASFQFLLQRYYQLQYFEIQRGNESKDAKSILMEYNFTVRSPMDIQFTLAGVPHYINNVEVDKAGNLPDIPAIQIFSAQMFADTIQYEKDPLYAVSIQQLTYTILYAPQIEGILNQLRAFNRFTSKELDYLCLPEYEANYPCLFKVYLQYNHKPKSNAANIWEYLKEKKPNLVSTIQNGQVYEFAQITGIPFFIPTGYYISAPIKKKDLVLVIYREHARIALGKKVIEYLNMPKRQFHLKPIKPTKEAEVFDYFLDIETWSKRTSDEKNEQVPYIICITGKQTVTFYGDKVLAQFAHWLHGLDQNSTHRFWSFNGSKFDYIFFLPIFIDQFEATLCGTKTNMKMIALNTNMVFLDIKLIYTRGSLKELAKTYKLTHQKIDFEVGNKAKEYYDKNKMQAIKYCQNDCYIVQDLLELVKKFLSTLMPGKPLELNNCYSVASLTMHVYRSLYQKVQIKGEDDRELVNIIRSSYYGGITQAFKKHSLKAYYYDINSSYPYVMTGKIPYKFVKKMVYDHTALIETNLYYARAVYKDQVIITGLPTRTKDGLYYFKQVDWSWRWGCEILQDMPRFQELEIKECMVFEADYIFREFILDMYERRKATKNEDEKLFYKLLMNNLYGKFGQREFPDTYYIEAKYLKEFLAGAHNADLQYSFNIIPDEKYEIKVMDTKNIHWIGSCVKIASFITAKARSNLLNAIHLLGDDHIFYCDTDSILTDRELPPEKVGAELGQFKLEHEVEEGFYFAPKLYYLETLHGQIYKAKGVMNPAELIINYMTKGKEEIFNENTFQRKYGQVLVYAQIKTINMENKRRKWVNDNDSVPYNNFNELKDG